MIAAIVGVMILVAASASPQEAAEAPTPRVALDLQRPPSPAELSTAVAMFAQAYPEFVRVETLGKSRGGEDLWAVTLAERLSLGGGLAGELARRPAIAIVAGLAEADAWGPWLALKSIEQLLQSHATDPRVADVLRHAVVHVIPCVDPDRRGGTGGEPTARAVELERNFPTAWSPWAERAGPYPLSEPETRAVVDFLAARGNVRVLVAFGANGANGARAASPADGPHARLLERATPALGGALELAAGGGGSGSLGEYARLELGALAFDALATGERASDDLDAFGKGFSRAALELAAALPRYELALVARERLKSDVWKLEVDVSNVGGLPSADDESMDARRSRLSVAGARVVAAARRRGSVGEFESLGLAGASLSVGRLDSGATVRARWIVEAGAQSRVAIALEAAGGGGAMLDVVLD